MATTAAPVTPAPDAETRFIRWKAVVPAAILVLAIFLFIYFFLDAFAKWAIKKGGEAAFGARVDIESVKVSLAQSRLRIVQLHVADKSEPMKNLFELQGATVDVESLPLLEKRFIIDQASITGMKFGTPRKTSGALPIVDKKPGIVGKATERLWSQVEALSMDKFDGIKKFYDPKTIVNPNELLTIKVAQGAKDQLQKMPAVLQDSIKQLDAQKRAEALKGRAEAIGKGPSDPASILQKVSEARAIQTDLMKLKADIAATQTSIENQIRSSGHLLNDVKNAKDQDLKRLRSALSLPTLDKESLARAVFGPAVIMWMEKILSWVQTSRQYMPAKPEAPPAPPRGKGRVIEFPKLHVLPRFLLKKAQVSGEVGHDNPFAFDGLIEGVTSNPPLYGNPATFNFKGSQGSRSFTANITLDHTHEPHAEQLTGEYNGFALAHLALGQKGSLGIELQHGVGHASGRVTVTGDNLSAKLQASASQTVIEPQLDFKSGSEIVKRLTNSITASLKELKTLTVEAGLEGSLASPNLEVRSNIGSAVADAMKRALGSEIDQQEQALKAEIDKQTYAKIQELNGMVQNLQKQFLPQLASQNQVVDQLLEQIKKQLNVPSSLPAQGLGNLKGLFGR